MVGSNIFRARFFSLYLPLCIYGLFLLFPFYWMLIVSVKPTNDLFDMQFNPFWIQHFTLENYLYLFQETDFPEWLKNTLIVSVVSTSLSLVCSVLIGYALARLRFPGSNFLGVGIFLAYLVPPTLLFLPLAQVIAFLNLYNTYWALILTYPTQLIPFASWLLMGYFRTIPKEIEESAMADGCTRLQILVRIVLPLSVPGLLSAGIFCFTLCWNEFLYALIFMSSGPMKTIPVGTVSDLIKADTLFWGSLMASAVLGSFPIAFIYSFFVKHYVSGLTAGAVKG
jgi:multiple sugar transport system permease protein